MTSARETLSLRIDPAVLDDAAARFATEGRVRLCGAFPPATAELLHRHLDTELAWNRAVNQGGKVWDLPPEGVAAMNGEAGASLLDAVHRAAQDGFQFLFDTVRVSEDPIERAERGLMLDALIEGLNTPQSLDTFRELVGEPAIERVDGQATRYLAGHFLTGHDDDVAGKDRVAAYVLGLSPRWRTEWGGLLQFHTDDGDVSHALMPRFNALHVFRVPQRHSVSLVAPFAGAPRYSVTGWLRRG